VRCRDFHTPKLVVQMISSPREILVSQAAVSMQVVAGNARLERQAFCEHFVLIILLFAVAEKYPNSTVRGIDLSPIQPTYVPRNVFFAVDDIEDEWVHSENSLDYIHLRHIIFSVRDIDTLLQRAYRFVHLSDPFTILWL
jgi:hypothetical protein